MCKFQAVQISIEKLRELRCKYINHSLKDGELILFYENEHGSTHEMLIKYRYFTPERLRAKIIMEVRNNE